MFNVVGCFHHVVDGDIAMHGRAFGWPRAESRLQLRDAIDGGGGRRDRLWREDSPIFADEDESLGEGRRTHVTNQWWKLEIPLFHGEDAFSWLDKIERYFAVKGVPEEQWLYAVKLAIEGKAVTWFQWWEENAAFQSWPIFKNAITKHFHPVLVQNSFEVMLSMK